MWIILCNVVLICRYQLIAFVIMWYYMCIIFCEIVLYLLKFEEHEIEEKRMCFEKCFLEFKKKNVNNNFYEKWGKILFFGRILKREKKWCRLMVKAFLLLSGINSAVSEHLQQSMPSQNIESETGKKRKRVFQQSL